MRCARCCLLCVGSSAWAEEEEEGGGVVERVWRHPAIAADGAFLSSAAVLASKRQHTSRSHTHTHKSRPAPTTTAHQQHNSTPLGARRRLASLLSSPSSSLSLSLKPKPATPHRTPGRAGRPLRVRARARLALVGGGGRKRVREREERAHHHPLSPKRARHHVLRHEPGPDAGPRARALWPQHAADDPQAPGGAGEVFSAVPARARRRRRRRCTRNDPLLTPTPIPLPPVNPKNQRSRAPATASTATSSPSSPSTTSAAANCATTGRAWPPFAWSTRR